MRAFPASVMVAGDISPDDQEVIDQINMVLAQKHFSYRLQPLSSEQVVLLAVEGAGDKEGELFGIARSASLAGTIAGAAHGARVVQIALLNLGRDMEQNQGRQTICDDRLILDAYEEFLAEKTGRRED